MIPKIHINRPQLKILAYSVIIMFAFMLVCKALSWKIMFQMTPSLPKGIYWIDRPDRINVGMLGVFSIPPKVYDLMKSRGWIPRNMRFYLMKPVVAGQGDVVDVSQSGLFINGKFFGPVKQYDSQGLPMPRLYRKYTLGPDEYFLASTYHNSFDSRYFGTLTRQDIKWVARPLLVMN